MILLKNIREGLLQLAFPHICQGCGSDMLAVSQNICLRCIALLPETKFQFHSANPVEKLFWGRVPITSASAHFYFSKHSIVQRLMHNFKYRKNKELGFQLGELIALGINSCNRFADVDALVPLPLSPMKERSRGFNQANILCEGMATRLGMTVLPQAVERARNTSTQTRKGRVERWQNMENGFFVKDEQLIQDKHLLLVDDVITTGATLEACAKALINVNGVRVSVATLCYASTM